MRLSAGPSFLKGVLSGFIDPRRLATGVFFLTDECNARCPYCFNVFLPHLRQGDARGRPLSLEEYTRIAGGTGGLFQVIFSGGEPFLRRDIDRVAETFYKEAGTRLFSIPTNGSLPEKTIAKVESMAQRCPRATFNIQVSLDAEGTRHDELRGLPGCFEKAVRLGHGLLELGDRQPGVTLVVNTVVTRETIAEVGALQSFLRAEFGGRLKYHNLQWDQRLGADLSADPALRGRLKELEGDGRKNSGGHGFLPGVIRKYYIGFINSLILSQLREDRMLYSCNAGRKLIVVMTDGEASPCEPFLFEKRYKDMRSFQIRDYGYNLKKLREDPEFKAQLRYIAAGSCAACPWSCAAISSMLYSPKNWPLLWSLPANGKVSPRSQMS